MVTVYCEPLPVDEAQALFEQFEAQGCRDVAALTGQAPCTFGQAGGAWSPVIYPALRAWGIPTYVDEGPWIGLDERPFWFMGVLSVMRMRSACTRFDHRREDGLAAGIAAYEKALDTLEARGAAAQHLLPPLRMEHRRVLGCGQLRQGGQPAARKHGDPRRCAAGRGGATFARMETFWATSPPAAPRA